jgi:hypothetical protein
MGNAALAEELANAEEPDKLYKLDASDDEDDEDDEDEDEED